MLFLPIVGQEIFYLVDGMCGYGAQHFFEPGGWFDAVHFAGTN